jgi:hypothetical protein
MLALREPVRQRRALLRDEKNTRAGSSHRGAGRDACATRAGMVRRRVTSSVKRCGAVASLLCSIFLPARICQKAMKLDVVTDRVTSPATREEMGSIPTWPKDSCSREARERGASNSVVRAPNVPWPLVPVQQFARRGQMEKHGTQLGQTLLPGGRRRVGFLNRSTFRLHRQS